MRREAFSRILEKASALFSGERAATAADGELLKVFLNRRAQEFWRRGWWPEWTLIEERTFRQPWVNGTLYAQSAEVYDIATGKYFQSLEADNLDEPTIDGEENSTFWAECAGSYSGDDWVSGRTYALGDIRRYVPTDRYYQCQAEHTASGTLTPVATGADKRWGILTPFIRDIDLEAGNQGTSATAIDAVRFVWDRDPRVDPDACQIDFELEETGVVVRGVQAVVWVEFRKRAPSWYGANWASTTTYADGDVVYSVAQGDFYESLQNANTNHAVTDGSWWSRLDFPWVLRECVPQAGYADMLRQDDQHDKFALQIREAARLLDEELVIVDRQKRRRGRWGR